MIFRTEENHGNACERRASTIITAESSAPLDHGCDHVQSDLHNISVSVPQESERRVCETLKRRVTLACERVK